MRLVNKVALVTGAGSGIGQATAFLFAQEGARIVVADQNESAAKGSVKVIEDAGGEATRVAGNVTDTSDAERMVATAERRFGGLNVLVNCAGITALGSNASPEDVWDRVMDVNLKGTYLLSWHAVPAMRRAGGGSIVNLASVMALVGIGYHPGRGFDPYPSSKAGVVQFSRNLAIDVAKENIRVNSICPGHVWTPLTEALTSDPEMLKQLETKYPLGRLGRPKEVAYAALFLASDESSFVTGSYLLVDGGFSAQ